MADTRDEHPNWPGLVPDEVQPWETLESRTLVDGFRRVLEDRARTASGVEVTYQYRPRGPRAVFVLPVTAAGEAVLIRQYRYPLRATVWEVVAGGVERGEELLGAAVRELAEEVGAGPPSGWAYPASTPSPASAGWCSIRCSRWA